MSFGPAQTIGYLLIAMVLTYWGALLAIASGTSKDLGMISGVIVTMGLFLSMASIQLK